MDAFVSFSCFCLVSKLNVLLNQNHPSYSFSYSSPDASYHALNKVEFPVACLQVLGILYTQQGVLP